MSKNSAKDWNKTREMGFIKYFLKEGLLFGVVYGLVATAVLLAIELLVLKSSFGNDTVLKAAAAFLLIAFANMVSAILVWFVNENKVKKQKN